MDTKRFTLKHCKGGFIFGYWSENNLGQNPEFVEEVVTEEDINNRIGEFLNVKAQIVSAGTCHWYVESSRMTPQQELPKDSPIPEGLMNAKLHYVHAKGIPGTVTMLQIRDGEKNLRYELIGKDAENFADNQQIKIGRKEGVPIIKLDCSADTGKMFDGMRPNVLTVTEDEVLQWYKRTRLVEEDCP